MTPDPDKPRPLLSDREDAQGQQPTQLQVMYHVSHRRNLDSIRQHGLVPTIEEHASPNWTEYSIVDNAVYLSPSISQAEAFRTEVAPQRLGWAAEDGVILRVQGLDSSELHPDPESLEIIMYRYLDDNDAQSIAEDPWFDPIRPLLERVSAPGRPSYAVDGRAVWEAYSQMEEPQRQMLSDWIGNVGWAIDMMHMGTIDPGELQIMNLSEHAPAIDEITSGHYEDSGDSCAQYYDASALGGTSHTL